MKIKRLDDSVNIIRVIRECFIDMFDRNIAKGILYTSSEYGILVRVPMLTDERTYPSNNFEVKGVSISDCINNSLKEINIFEECENCLHKFSIEYPKINYSIDIKISRFEQYGFCRQMSIKFIL